MREERDLSDVKINMHNEMSGRRKQTMDYTNKSAQDRIHLFLTENDWQIAAEKALVASKCAYIV